MTYHRVCNKRNTTGAACVAGTVYPYAEHEFIPVFDGVSVARSLVFCMVSGVPLFALLFLVIVLPVLQFTAFYYSFSAFKLFFQ